VMRASGRGKVRVSEEETYVEERKELSPFSEGELQLLVLMLRREPLLDEEDL